MLILSYIFELISLYDLSTQRYRNELTPNITFQSNKIFVTKDLFEKIIKSCKATNLEFLKLKGKVGLCIYEEICDEKEFILISEKTFTQHDCCIHFIQKKMRK